MGPMSAATPPTERRVSARVGAISESATLAVDAKAKALKAAGRPVIGFGAGEPDFPTPDYIVEAAVEACKNPKYHRYTPAGGLPELKAAIAAKTLRDSGYEVDAVAGPGDQRRQAGHLRGLRRDPRPGRRGHRPGAVLDDLPGVDPSRRRCPGRGRRRRDHRLPRLRRAVGGGPHGEHQGACSSSRPPTRPARSTARARDRGDRPLGRRARPVGPDRRDLRAPGLRRRRVPLAARRSCPSCATSASWSTVSRRRTR